MNTDRITAAAFAAAVAVAAWVQPVAAQEDDTEIGAFEYRVYCASCHGPKGKGDGPVAEVLTKKPYDLREMSVRNGGEFPFFEAYDVIAGDKDVQGHGGREMPVWGPRFSVEAVERIRHGPPTPDESVEELVQGRILRLVYYLQSIQQEE